MNQFKDAWNFYLNHWQYFALLAAPILAVSGEIEISLGSTSLVNTALTNNTGDAVLQGLMDNGGDGNGGVEPFRDLYGVNDDLIWVDTTA